MSTLSMHEKRGSSQSSSFPPQYLGVTLYIHCTSIFSAEHPTV